VTTLQVELPPETEARLRAEAAAAGKDPATFVREAVEEKLAWASDDMAERPKLSTQERIAEWMAWGGSHVPLGRDADDSRETIYEGRGE
jgi:hypothetical protein